MTAKGIDFNAEMSARDGQGHCPDCGKPVPPKTRGLVKTFCSTACRQSFWRRWQKRGQACAPLLAAQLATRHAKPETDDAALCTFARREYTQMCTEWALEDEDAGRPPIKDYVAALKATGYLYADRRRS